jgi:DNA-binding transcriptional ArsR family regulator
VFAWVRNLDIFENAKMLTMPHRASALYIAKAEFFRTLGHPARVRILELLRDGERSVGSLQHELGLDSGGTSQQLSALRRIGLVESRRVGTTVLYRVSDDAVFELLELARGILGRGAQTRRALLEELAAE